MGGSAYSRSNDQDDVRDATASIAAGSTQRLELENVPDPHPTADGPTDDTTYPLPAPPGPVQLPSQPATLIDRRVGVVRTDPLAVDCGTHCDRDTRSAIRSK